MKGMKNRNSVIFINTVQEVVVLMRIQFTQITNVATRSKQQIIDREEGRGREVQRKAWRR